MNIPGTFVDFVMLTEDIFVVAMSDKLYRSVNGGATWTTTTFPVVVNSIAVKNHNEFFITSNSTAHYSADGGNIWQTKTRNDGGTGMYIGNDLFAMPNFKSTDNGQTWDYFLPQTLSSTTFFDIAFNGDNGLLGKQKGRVSFSKDKGRSFGYDVILPTSLDIMAVEVLNNGVYLAGDRNGQVLYSSDQGANWVMRNTNTIPNNPIKFSHSANDRVIVMSCTGQPVFSDDYGVTFNVVSVGGGTHKQTVKPNGEIIDVFFEAFQNVGWELSRWTPAGVKTVIDSFTADNESLIEIHAATDNVGYLLTYNNTTKTTLIYKTTNGFAAGGTSLLSSINPVNSGVTNYLPGKIKIHTFGTDTIILVGDGNNFYHYSNDGGQTWSKITSPASISYPSLYPSLKKSHFFNADEYVLLLKNTGVYLNVNSSNNPLGVTDLVLNSESKNELKIYPNPCNSVISIKDKGTVDVLIFDVNGRKVFEKLNFNSTFESLNVANLSSGFYILKVTSLDKVATGRFVKRAY